MSEEDTVSTEPRPLTAEEVYAEHRECGKPKYDGCYAHYPMAHCRADGMTWPCDVHTLATLVASLAVARSTDFLVEAVAAARDEELSIAKLETALSVRASAPRDERLEALRALSDASRRRERGVVSEEVTVSTEPLSKVRDAIPESEDGAGLRAAVQAYIDWQYRNPGARKFGLGDLRAALAASRPVADHPEITPLDQRPGKPRTATAARIHASKDGCNGRPHTRWYRGPNKCDRLAAVAERTDG